MEKTTITCPHCEDSQEIDVPEDSCLAFYECGGCKKLISGTEENKGCACVVCAHSDTTCPVSHVKQDS